MVFGPPSPEVAEQIAEIEQIAGVLPLSLRAWFEIVGEVDFTGSHPDWPGGSDQPPVYPDPLVMISAEKWLRENRGRGRRRIGPQTCFSVSLPDYYIKEEISGGNYWIALPNLAADVKFEGLWYSQDYRPMAPIPPTPIENTFVNYLRTCFRWGGFPGFAFSAQRPEKDLAQLVDGLLPI
jgi:hypothetical protein